MNSKTTRRIAIIGITALALVLASAAYAEKGKRDGKGRNGGQRGFDIERMRKNLNLDDAQVKKIESIKKQYEGQFKAHRESIKPKQEKMRELMNADPVDMKQLETHMRAMSEDRIKMRLQMIKMRNEIGAVLTKEQKQKMQEQRKARWENRKDKGEFKGRGEGRRNKDR